MQGAHARRTRCFDALLPLWNHANGMVQLPLHGDEDQVHVFFVDYNHSCFVSPTAAVWA